MDSQNPPEVSEVEARGYDTYDEEIEEDQENVDDFEERSFEDDDDLVAEQLQRRQEEETDEPQRSLEDEDVTLEDDIEEPEERSLDEIENDETGK